MCIKNQTFPFLKSDTAPTWTAIELLHTISIISHVATIIQLFIPENKTKQNTSPHLLLFFYGLFFLLKQ